MKVARLEAFTDGILVIIFTIMVLEFKVPDTSYISAILQQFPYFISYTIGWLFLAEAWYNHLFIVSHVKQVTHKIFLINGFWLFTTSFLPLATAWIGKDLFARGPEIFYGIIFFVWTFAFLMLVQTVINDNQRHGRVKEATALRHMRIYRYLTNPFIMSIQMLIWVLVLIWAPQCQLIIMVWQIMFVAGSTNREIDHHHHVKDSN